MGSYTFRWAHPAEEVYVTGTFDDWAKTEKLEKGADGVFEKTLTLKKPEDKILYKFVADGDWKYDHTGKSEPDESGNLNNVLYPDDLKESDSSTHMLSGVAPGATTTGMAGAVPLEKSGKEQDTGSAAINSVGPDSSTNEMAGKQALTKDEESAPRSYPGAFPDTPSNEPADDQTYSVNPLPASSGMDNPINLKPGEPVPRGDSSALTSNVHDDPELKAADEAKNASAGNVDKPMELAPQEPETAANAPAATAGAGAEEGLAPAVTEPSIPDQAAVSEEKDSGLNADKNTPAVPATQKSAKESSGLSGGQAAAAAGAAGAGAAGAAFSAKAIAERATGGPVSDKAPQLPEPEKSEPLAVPETSSATAAADTAGDARNETKASDQVKAGAGEEDRLRSPEKKEPARSRDVSPMSRPAKTSADEAQSSTPKKTGWQDGANDKAATPKSNKTEKSDKGDKRRSFFGRLKDKLKS